MQCRIAATCSKSRHLLKILTFLTCCIFVFIICFFNGTQQVVEMSVERATNVSPASYCNRSVRWFAQTDENYSVLYNFIPSDNVYRYNESVTYVTHATFRYLSHLENVALRWNGPISVAVYAPSTDFDAAVSVIAHLRQCGHPSLRRSTSFHLFYDAKLTPSSIPCFLDEAQLSGRTNSTLDCQNYVPPDVSYQVDNKLTYPVNVARNIARLSAQTKYVLVSDVELYPSANMGPMFLSMIKPTNVKSNVSVAREEKPNRTVYVLPIFEVDKKVEAPETKKQLLEMLKKQVVIPFHKFVCPECHRVPRQDQWLKSSTDRNSTSVFYTTKRHKPYNNWEPIYIGTNDEPLYDGRLNWEGMSDKMTQAYEMCLLDYNFSVLENAFLVHAPGIKRVNKTASAWRKGFVTKNSRLRKQIKKELISKYRPNPSCTL